MIDLPFSEHMSVWSRVSDFARHIVDAERIALGVLRAPLPTYAVDANVYRELAELFDAIEDDELSPHHRDSEHLLRLAESLEHRPKRLRNVNPKTMVRRVS